MTEGIQDIIELNKKLTEVLEKLDEAVDLLGDIKDNTADEET